MAATSTVSVDIDPNIKRGAEKIFQQLGLTASQAVSLFYRQVQLHHGLPFSVDAPNDATLKALEEAKDRESLPRFDTPDELFEDLGI